MGVTLKLGDTHLAFVGSHLAAHQGQVARRNHDVGEIIEEVGGGGEWMVGMWRREAAMGGLVQPLK